MKIEVYRNLNRKGVVWSMRSVDTKRVVDRQTFVCMKNCTFKVSEAGRRRVIKAKSKNQHAQVRGDLFSDQCIFQSEKKRWIKVHYNPYKNKYFHTKSGRPLLSAKYVKFTDKGCFATGVKYGRI